MYLTWYVLLILTVILTPHRLTAESYQEMDKLTKKLTKEWNNIADIKSICTYWTEVWMQTWKLSISLSNQIAYVETVFIIVSVYNICHYFVQSKKQVGKKWRNCLKNYTNYICEIITNCQKWYNDTLWSTSVYSENCCHIL